MKVLDCAQLPNAVRSIAVSPSGDRVAVAAGPGEWLDDMPPEETDGSTEETAAGDQTLHLFRIRKKGLVAERAIVLHGVADATEETPEDSPTYESTRLAFRDDRTVLVARMVERSSPKWSRQVEVFAVDLKTGEQHGRCLDDRAASHISGLVLASPKHLLLGTRSTIICLDPSSLDEVCRARPINETGDPDEEDADPEEAIPPGGFAYDVGRHLLYMLGGYYDGGALSCYRFYVGRKEFVRKSRRDVCETRPAKDIDLAATCGLCLNPDGKGVTAVFKLEDLTLDLWGRPVADFEAARTKAIAQQGRGEVPPPATARLGWLAILRDKEDDWIEIHSDLSRDFDGGEECEEDEDGETLHIGYRVCSRDGWEPEPVYIDDCHVLIGTPSGLLVVVDVTTGESTVEHDTQAPITSLRFCAPKGCLLAGGEDGSLTVLAVEAQKKAKRARRSRTRVSKSKARPRKRKTPAKQPPVIEDSVAYSLVPAVSGECVAITPDGRRAACGLFVWDVEEQWNTAAFEKRGDPVTSVALTPDGQRLLGGSLFDHALYLWDVATGQRLLTLETPDMVHDVALSPDGERGASAGSRGAVRVWDLGTGRCLSVLEGHTDEVRAVAFSPDGRRVISGSLDMTLRVWDLESEECLLTCEGHSDEVVDVVWTPNGRRAVSASFDRTLRVWDVKSGRCPQVLKGHTEAVGCVDVTADGKRAVSGSADRTLRVWNVETGKCIKTLRGSKWPLTSVAVSADGRAVSASDAIRMWDIIKGRSLGVVGSDWGEPTEMAMTPDGRHTITRSIQWSDEEADDTEADEDEEALPTHIMQLWDLETRECLTTVSHTPEASGRNMLASSVGLSADGRIVAGVADDQTVRIWDVAGERSLATLEGHTAVVECVTLSADGTRAASGSYDKKVRVCDVATGACIATLECHTEYITAVLFSRDGRHIVSGSRDGSARVWEAETGRCLAVLEGPTGQEVVALALSADVSRIATSYGSTIRLWDVQTGDALVDYVQEGQYAQGLAFHGNGRSLISASGSIVRLWPLPEGHRSPP